MSGAPGAWLETNSTRLYLGRADFGNLATSSAWKVVLLGVGSNIGPASTIYSALTDEVANGNGYTTGGLAATLAEGGTLPEVTYSFSSNITWTATGGSIPTSGDAPYWAAVCAATGGYILAYLQLDTTPTSITTTTGLQLQLNTTMPVFALN